MNKILYLLVFFFLITSNFVNASDGVIKIVVLGSSTAAGSGPTNIANAWVNQYRDYVQSVNSSNEVINLAVGGYTTYKVMPSDYTPPTDRPAPDPEHNITKALSLAPDVIIINLPTNDAASYYTVKEQLNNYKLILAKAVAQNVPVYIATTQPRNFSLEQRQNLIAVRDSTIKYLGTKAIDFWTDIATAEGMINPIYDIGDGVHLNDAAHTLLAKRVESEDILTYSHVESAIDTVNIDFGTNLSTNGWNNLNSAYQDTIVNLVNSNNKSTGISVWVHDSFTWVNTSGTTAPNVSVNMPSTATSDSFFGSVSAFNGVTEPTGGITLSGLNRNSIYSFTFFASRTGVTDNRQSQYTVTGKTEKVVVLDPSNNTSNVVSANDIVPADNGTIVITVGPGPDNNNASKFYFIGAVRMVSEKHDVVYDTDGKINIDLGSTLSTGAWNNLVAAVGGEKLTDLVNTEGNSTGISAWVNDSFTGVNVAGTTTPDAALGIDGTGSSDNFFGSTGLHSGVIEATGGVTLGGLSLTSKYSLSFFASRTGVTDNRETQYVVTGKTVETVYLDAANNTKNMVTVANMVPADNGTITIVASPGPNNNNSLKYYYLGVIRIEYSPLSTGTADVSLSSKNEILTSIYPNPSENGVTFDCALPESGEIQVKIFNINGQLEKMLVSKNQSKGNINIHWDGTSNGKKAKSGLYICQISMITPNKVYTQTQKLVIK